MDKLFNLSNTLLLIKLRELKETMCQYNDTQESVNGNYDYCYWLTYHLLIFLVGKKKTWMFGAWIIKSGVCEVQLLSKQAVNLTIFFQLIEFEVIFRK